MRTRSLALLCVAASLAAVLAALVVSAHAHKATPHAAGKRHATPHTYNTRAGPRPGMLNVHLVSHSTLRVRARVGVCMLQTTARVDALSRACVRCIR